MWVNHSSRQKLAGSAEHTVARGGGACVSVRATAEKTKREEKRDGIDIRKGKLRLEVAERECGDQPCHVLVRSEGLEPHFGA